MSQQSVLFVIVGRNEPLFEAEFHKRGAAAASNPASDAVMRQNFFVLHSALDLVEKATWSSNNMYLRVIDKVRYTVCASNSIRCGAPIEEEADPRRFVP